MDIGRIERIERREVEVPDWRRKPVRTPAQEPAREPTQRPTKAPTKEPVPA